LALILVFLYEYPTALLIIILIIMVLKIGIDYYLMPYKMKSLNFLRILNDLIIISYFTLLLIIRI
jgi:hypothetical protein